MKYKNFLVYKKMLHVVEKKLSQSEMLSRAGDFFDLEDCDIIIENDCNVINSEGVLLFSINKNVIPEYISRSAREAFRKQAKKTTTNSRGAASGKIDLDRVPSSAVELLTPNKFASNLLYADGTVSSYKVSNTVHSMIAGFYDKPKRSNPGGQKIRPTAFCEKYPQLWSNYAVPYVQYIDAFYAERFPDNYVMRKSQCDRVPYGMIANTIFTTITANYNFRTAAHVDKGDLQGGYSILTVHGEWTGGILIYPQYRIGVKVMDGDFLIMNPHEYHCNSAIYPSKNGITDRLSLVIYARDRIIFP